MTATSSSANYVHIQPLPEEFDRVVLLRGFPGKGLERGDVGAVVHIYGEHDGYEVEFSDIAGNMVLQTVGAKDVELAPPPCTLTTSNPGQYWIQDVTWQTDDDPSTPEEDAEDARICDERRNGPFLPLWMILRLPSWVCGVCFWVKRRLGLR